MTLIFYVWLIKKLNEQINADLEHPVNWVNANKIWLNANKTSHNVEKTEMVILKSKQKKFEGNLKIMVDITLLKELRT